MNVMNIFPDELEDYNKAFNRTIKDVDGDGEYLDFEIKANLNSKNPGWDYLNLIKDRAGHSMEFYYNTAWQDVQNLDILIFKDDPIRSVPWRPTFDVCELRIRIPKEDLEFKDRIHETVIDSSDVIICEDSDIVIIFDKHETKELNCYYFDDDNGILFYGDEVAGVLMKNITNEERRELLQYRTYDKETRSWIDKREKVGPPVKLMTPYVKK